MTAQSIPAPARRALAVLEALGYAPKVTERSDHVASVGFVSDGIPFSPHVDPEDADFFRLEAGYRFADPYPDEVALLRAAQQVEIANRRVKVLVHERREAVPFRSGIFLGKRPRTKELVERHIAALRHAPQFFRVAGFPRSHARA